MDKRAQIKQRLKQFKSLTKEQKFKEFQFCLLTPQSNAQRCWQAVEEISKIKNPTEKQISEILSTKTRFHNTKAKRIIRAKVTFNNVWPKIRAGGWAPSKIIDLRSHLAKQVNGYGLKETSHFLRNIGLSNNQIAILDRHILRNLKEEKIKSPKHYLKIEQKFLSIAKSKKIPADELDLLWWSQENGEIFK